MELLYDNRIINEIVTKLFRHRKNDYSEFQLEQAISAHDLKHQLLPIRNHNFQQLCVSLFTRKQSEGQTAKATTCIVFLHGYGSNRLECLNLLPFISSGVMKKDDEAQSCALCSLDFSGSGKSQGDQVTYGVKEQEDIDCTLNYLRKRGFIRFVLWGRSMGATTALLFSQRHPEGLVLQVIDSAFYSFQTIAFQIASKNVKAPDFLISFALQMSKRNCQKLQCNPFKIELANANECDVPAIFVYCQQDNVISAKNTHLICEKYGANFEKLVIQENHNTIRTPATLLKIFELIGKYLRLEKVKEKQSNFYMINIKDRPKKLKSSIVSKKGEANMLRQSRRGIERVHEDIKNKVPKTQKFDDYGIWVASKLKKNQQDHLRHPEFTHINHFKSQKSELTFLENSLNPNKDLSIKAFKTPSRGHLSLSTSVANRNSLSVSGARGEQWRNSGIQMGSVRSLLNGSKLHNSKYL